MKNVAFLSIIIILLISCSKAQKEKRVLAKQASVEMCHCMQPMIEAFRKYRANDVEAIEKKSVLMDEATALSLPCLKTTSSKYRDHLDDPQFVQHVLSYLEFDCTYYSAMIERLQMKR